MIRLAIHGDIKNALPLVESFFKESLQEFGFPLELDALIKNMKEHCDKKSCLVIEEEGKIVGLIAGKFVQFPISNYKVYQEIMWYVLPEYRRHGLRLFRETEKYCKSIGINAIIMGNMANLNKAKMSKFYRFQGYKPMEVQWIKQL